MTINHLLAAILFHLNCCLQICTVGRLPVHSRFRDRNWLVAPTTCRSVAVAAYAGWRDQDGIGSQAASRAAFHLTDTRFGSSGGTRGRADQALTAAPNPTLANKPVTFSVQGTGNCHFRLNFGDGTPPLTATVPLPYQPPTHSYPRSGT